MTSSTLISNVLCSIQGALLGYVTPNLRAVDVVIENERKFNIFFYYDKELSEEEDELPSLVETEFVADFPPPEYEINGTVKILPYPKRFPQNEDIFRVYRRYESSINIL